MKGFFLPGMLLLLSIVDSKGQPGTWTWMKGSSVVNDPGNFGTMGVSALTNVPPANYEAAEWTDLQGRFWLYGPGNTSTMWMYDPATNIWTWMSGSNVLGAPPVYGTMGVSATSNDPGARGFTSFTWVDLAGNLWMFGGLNSGGALADLWRYNTGTLQWTWISGSSAPNAIGNYGTQGVPSVGNYPSSRSESSAAWTDNAGNLWLFGGNFQNQDPMNDLWKYDITANTWTWMRGASTPLSLGNYGAQGVSSPANDPPSRSVWTKWKDKNNNLWLFGGASRVGMTMVIRNDLWKYNITTNEWTWMRGSMVQDTIGSVGAPCQRLTTNDPPGRMEGRACWTDTCGNFWMLGGLKAFGLAGTINDLWHYNVQLNIWTQVQANGPGVYGVVGIPNPANKVTARVGANPFTESNGNLWVFGGQSSGGTLNDLWRYAIDTSCAGSCVTVPQIPVAGFSATNLSGCAPLTVTFTNTSSNSTSWSWNFGDGGTSTAQHPAHTYTASGTYSVTLIAYNPPNSDTLVQVNYVTVGQSPVLNAATTTSVSCNGGNNGAASVSVTTGVPVYTYVWSNGASTSSATGLTAGNYSVVVTDASGCTSSQSVSILQPTALTSTITNTQSSCNSSDGTATVIASGGSGSFTYLWNPTSVSTGTVTGLSAGVYSVTITDSNGCTQVTTTTITNSNGPTAFAMGNTSIQIGSSTTLNASGGIAYAWTPAYGLNDTTLANPTASPSVTTVYCVFVFDSSGCYDSACVTVTVVPEPVVCGEFYLPNAFSPNGDNENDFFKAYIHPLCVVEFKLTIYNRWGEKVFETNNVTQGWDGVYGLRESNTAVYAYYCRAVMSTGEEIIKVGNVSLIK